MFGGREISYFYFLVDGFLGEPVFYLLIFLGGAATCWWERVIFRKEALYSFSRKSIYEGFISKRVVRGTYLCFAARRKG
jgi:hypothetical protein